MRVRPYIFAGMGSNLLREYVVENGRAVTVQGLVLKSSTADVPLTRDTSIRPIRHHRILDLGDISITAPSASAVWTNVRGVNEVVKKLKDIADARAGEAAADASDSRADPAWHAGLEVESHVIVIPHAPDFEVVMWTASMGAGLTAKAALQGRVSETLVRESDWVRKGQKIATINGYPVHAPVDGRVASIGWAGAFPAGGSDEERYWSGTTWDAEKYASRFLMSLHPVRGRGVETAGFCFRTYMDAATSAVHSRGYRDELTRGVEPEAATKRLAEAIADMTARMDIARRFALPLAKLERGKLEPL